MQTGVYTLPNQRADSLQCENRHYFLNPNVNLLGQIY